MNGVKALILAVALMGWATAGLAQSFEIPPGRWWEVPRLVQDLGLTPEQRTALAEASRTHVRNLADLRAEVTKAQVDLQEAAEREPFSAGDVRKAFSVLQAARARLELERFELVISVREILSAEQWRKLQGLVRDRRERLREEGGPRPEPEARRPPLRRPAQNRPRGERPPQGETW